MQSTISRFACRILVDRTEATKARIYAAGFDSSRNIFLGVSKFNLIFNMLLFFIILLFLIAVIRLTNRRHLFQRSYHRNIFPHMLLRNIVTTERFFFNFSITHMTLFSLFTLERIIL